MAATSYLREAGGKPESAIVMELVHPETQAPAEHCHILVKKIFIFAQLYVEVPIEVTWNCQCAIEKKNEISKNQLKHTWDVNSTS